MMQRGSTEMQRTNTLHESREEGWKRKPVLRISILGLDTLSVISVTMSVLIELNFLA